MATANMYGAFIVKLLNKEIDWDSDTINVALVADTYTPNQDTHEYWDDVVAHEVSGTGYTANGIALTSKTPATMAAFPTGMYVSAGNIIRLDADNVTWVDSTITARYAVVYDRTPASDATRPLLGWVDFEENKSSSDGDFTVGWNLDGLFEITVT